MKRTNISQNVIRRLPRYLRKLDDLAYHGVERISSAELGRQMSLTPSQIRQDFSCFGEFGQQGYGYYVQNLRDEISNILGMNRGYKVILVGVGNLGRALIGNFGFDRQGFDLIAAFDIDPGLVGTELDEVPIMDTRTMGDFLKDRHVDIAVLTVPRRVANDVANAVVKAGVRSIWNVTNLELDVDSDSVLIENIHFSDSLLALSYWLTEKDEEKNA